MKPPPAKVCLQPVSVLVGKWLLFLAVLTAANLPQQASGQKTHRLRQRGKTLIEGEDFSAISDFRYRIEESEWCSGKKNLGYFWANAWVELKVDVPQMLNYTLSLQTASREGSQFEISVVEAEGKETLLAKLDVPKTGAWEKYVSSQDLTISLPSGVHTLRFKNLDGGTNIDYFTFSAGDRDAVVTSRPATTAGPDINPLKGFKSGWRRENDDYASVGYQYIEWGKLEPEDDVFDWDYVEEVLSRSGSRGRHLILQMVVDWDDWHNQEPEGDSHYKGPGWLLDQVGENRGPAFPADPNSRISRATRYDDPGFIEEATEAIEALLKHYRDDPRMFVFQAGVVGFRGEWHNDPREDWSPNASTKAAILNAYLKHLGTDGLTQIPYPDEPAVEPRASLGYTNGSATLTDNGLTFGAAIAKKKLWKNGPISGEWPANVEAEYWDQFFNSEAGKSLIDQGRYSTLLVPELKEIRKVLPDYRFNERFKKMHRQMGYNFQVKAVRHLVAVDDSGLTHLEVDLHNAGIAPFYKNWDVQLAILKADNAEPFDIIGIDIDLRKLGPGETVRIAGSSNKELDRAWTIKLVFEFFNPVRTNQRKPNGDSPRVIPTLSSPTRSP